MSRPPISVCVVAMNEEDNIAECLASADFVDERISTLCTPTLARLRRS